jgi:transglutaminase-like putative cysteine protease
MTDPTLAPTPLIDSDHPTVVEFARRHAHGTTDIERAVALYYAVRDGFRYDPYRINLMPQGMRASTVIANGYGWCVPKATLLAAVCRAAGIPARVGFADVRNHLSTERMRQVMGTDLFYWHGFAELRLAGRWLKATPAFNVELCDRFGLLPLEFNGLEDSIYHPFDRQGHRHMEYVAQRGSFDEVPLAVIVADFARLYPAWRPQLEALSQGDFLADVTRETGR